MRLVLCHYAGCNAMTPNYYCPKHEKIQQARRQEHNTLFEGTRREKSARYNALYHTGKWRAMRAAHLKAYPYCVMCGGVATVADHIEPHCGNEEVFFNERNLQSLCASCHSKKTLKENGYFRRANR